MSGNADTRNHYLLLLWSLVMVLGDSQVKLWRSLNNKVSLAHFLLSYREGHPSDDNNEVMLSLRSLLQGQPSTKWAGLCWIISILLIQCSPMNNFNSIIGNNENLLTLKISAWNIPTTYSMCVHECVHACVCVCALTGTSFSFLHNTSMPLDKSKHQFNLLRWVKLILNSSLYIFTWFS